MPDGSIQRVLQLAAQGAREYSVEEYDTDWDSDAYFTVSGQNANNSVRVPAAFFSALEADREWYLTRRTDGEVASTVPASKLWDDIALAAWECADPGVQYDTTINDWNPGANTDRQHATNPCSEFSFINDTSCNLASLNLMKFRTPEGEFDTDAFRYAARVMILAMEIIVGNSSYPRDEIEVNSHKFRPLGLGYAMVGGRDQLGFAANWGRAPDNPRDQVQLEAYYRASIVPGLSVAPSAQFILDPADNPELASLWLLAVRLRAVW